MKKLKIFSLTYHVNFAIEASLIQTDRERDREREGDGDIV